MEIESPWLYDAPAQAVRFRDGDIWRRGIVDLSWPTETDIQAFSTGKNLSRIPLDWQGIEQSDLETLQPEHCYASWVPVTAEATQALMEEPFRYPDRHRVWLGVEPQETLPTVSPAQSVAAWVESALVSEDKSCSLFHRLKSETEAMIELVREYTHECREAALHRIATARQLWKAHMVPNDDHSQS